MMKLYIFLIVIISAYSSKAFHIGNLTDMPLDIYLQFGQADPETGRRIIVRFSLDKGERESLDSLKKRIGLPVGLTFPLSEKHLPLQVRVFESGTKVLDKTYTPQEFSLTDINNPNIVFYITDLEGVGWQAKKVDVSKELKKKDKPQSVTPQKPKPVSQAERKGAAARGKPVRSLTPEKGHSRIISELLAAGASIQQKPKSKSGQFLEVPKVKTLKRYSN